MDRTTAKICGIFFKFWIIKIFPFFINVFLIEIFFFCRNERGLNVSIRKISPWKISKPWMIFNFSCSIVSKSISGFSLDHFIDKISSFDWPSSWNFSFFNLNLFRQNMISNFFSRFSLIRSFSIHTFICHDTYCKIIHRRRMILSAHNFWCHISWSSRSILSIFWSPYSCNSEICYPDVTIHVDHQVFWFDISMNNFFLMAVFQSSNQTGHEEF